MLMAPEIGFEPLIIFYYNLLSDVVFVGKSSDFLPRKPGRRFLKIRSGGAGIPFPQTPFPSRPALAWAKKF